MKNFIKKILNHRETKYQSEFNFEMIGKENLESIERYVSGKTVICYYKNNQHCTTYLKTTNKIHTRLVKEFNEVVKG